MILTLVTVPFCSDFCFATIQCKCVHAECSTIVRARLDPICFHLSVTFPDLYTVAHKSYQRKITRIVTANASQDVEKRGRKNDWIPLSVGTWKAGKTRRRKVALSISIAPFQCRGCGPSTQANTGQTRCCREAAGKNRKTVDSTAAVDSLQMF